MDIRTGKRPTNAAVTDFPVSPAERETRRDLAAAYRLIAHYGYDDTLATHLSARVPSPHGDTFLINPFGMLFEEITASSLVKVNLAGEILQDTPYQINRAGFVIHSAIHAVGNHAHAVMHLHTHDGVAVSTLDEGLLPLNQSAMAMIGHIAFHDYEGVAVNDDEKARLVADLGDKRLMLLRNHGTLAVGESVAEAFLRITRLEWACTTQVRTLGMGRRLRDADSKAIALTSDMYANQSSLGRYAQELFWPAVLRKLDRVNPGYAD